MIRIVVPPKGKFWFALTRTRGDQRDQRDQPQVQRPGRGDPREHVREVLLGRLARPDAGMKPPYFFMLSATSSGLKVMAT
jgi:hypothetical protein